jgi:hypothetical protein
MRVVCIYTKLDPATEFVLKWQIDKKQIEVEYAQIENDFSYFDIFQRHWDYAAGFITVEGDVLPWPGALEEIANCHHGCCNFWGPSGWNRDRYALGYGLGCTKFSARLIASHPDMMEHFITKGLGKHWHHLDGQIFDYLQQHGEGIHFHSPPVTHLNRGRYPQ